MTPWRIDIGPFYCLARGYPDGTWRWGVGTDVGEASAFLAEGDGQSLEMAQDRAIEAARRLPRGACSSTAYSSSSVT